MIESQQLLQRATDLGTAALTRLREFQATHELVSDVRGVGLALGVELSKDGKPARAEAQQVLYECLSNGLSFKISGGNVLTLTPPLTITDSELDRAFTIVETAIDSVSAT